MTNREALSRRSILQIGGTLGGLGLARDLGGTSAFAADALPRATIITTAGSLSIVVDALVKQEGFFKQMGVDAETQNVSDGSKVIASLLGGSGDLCGGSGFSSLFPAIEKGAKIKILAGGALSPYNAVFAKRADIKSLRDIEGKTYGIGAPGALVHQMIVALLIKKGIDYTKVTFINIGSTPDIFKAVVAGRVDAGVGEIDVYDQQDKYGVHALTDGAFWDELPEYTNQAMFASDQAIAEKRDVLVRCMAAYAKVFRFAQSPASQEAWRKARATARGKDDAEEALAQWTFFRKPGRLAANLDMSEARTDYVQSLNVKLGVQQKILPFAQVADISLAREALKLLD